MNQSIWRNPTIDSSVYAQIQHVVFVNSQLGFPDTLRQTEMPPLGVDEPNGEPLKVFEWSEIMKHDKENDAWVVKDGEVDFQAMAVREGMLSPPQVFDVSKFLKEHPGGSTIVLPYDEDLRRCDPPDGCCSHLGTDITEVFSNDDVHVHSKAAHSMMQRYRIGILSGAKRKAAPQNQEMKALDFSKPIIMQV